MQKFVRVSLALLSVPALSSCAALGADGPSSHAVLRAGQDGMRPLVLDVSTAISERVTAASPEGSLATEIGDGEGMGNLLQPGDRLSISLFEAPPAVLFGVVDPTAIGTASPVRSSGSVQVPDLLVDSQGQISVPFAGTLNVSGRTIGQVERMIVGRLSRKANQPQAVVRLTSKGSAEVVVLGNVKSAGNYPLAPSRERLLDVVAQAGGPTTAANRTSIRLERAGRSVTVPLETVLRTPRENVILTRGDVVSLISDSKRFVAMGAVSKPAEYDFESTGLTLAQALGRIGGLRQDRADIKGIFLFRYENAAAFPSDYLAGQQYTPGPDGSVPIIYRLDLQQPTSIFAASRFPVKDGDVLYVSTALGSDLQRVVGAVSQGVFSIAGIGNLGQ